MMSGEIRRVFQKRKLLYVFGNPDFGGENFYVAKLPEIFGGEGISPSPQYYSLQKFGIGMVFFRKKNEPGQFSLFRLIALAMRRFSLPQ